MNKKAFEALPEPEISRQKKLMLLDLFGDLDMDVPYTIEWFDGLSKVTRKNISDWFDANKNTASPEEAKNKFEAILRADPLHAAEEAGQLRLFAAVKQNKKALKHFAHQLRKAFELTNPTAEDFKKPIVNMRVGDIVKIKDNIIDESKNSINPMYKEENRGVLGKVMNVTEDGINVKWPNQHYLENLFISPKVLEVMNTFTSWNK